MLDWVPRKSSYVARADAIGEARNGLTRDKGLLGGGCGRAERVGRIPA